MRQNMPAFRKSVWLLAGASSVSIFRSCPSMCTGFPRYSVTRTGTPLTSGIVPEIVTVAEPRRPPMSISRPVAGQAAGKASRAAALAA